MTEEEIRADERAKIVAYIQGVGAQQQGYADRASCDMQYAGRLRSRAYMARALALRIARGDHQSFPEPLLLDEVKQERK